jgi:hypothetical protein
LPSAVRLGALTADGLLPWTASVPTASNVDAGMEVSADTSAASAAPDGPVSDFLPPTARRTATRAPTTTMTTAMAPEAISTRRRRSARAWAAR